MSIRLRRNQNYSLIDFIVKYDKSVDWPIWYGSSTFGTPPGSLSLTQNVDMTIVNDNIVVFRKEGESRVFMVITKASKNIIDHIKEWPNVNYLGKRTVNPPSGGIKKAIDVRNKNVATVARDIGASYNNQTFRLL